VGGSQTSSGALCATLISARRVPGECSAPLQALHSRTRQLMRLLAGAPSPTNSSTPARAGRASSRRMLVGAMTRLTNGPHAFLKGGFPVPCTRRGGTDDSSCRSCPHAAHTACHYFWRSHQTSAEASHVMAIERSAMGQSDLAQCAQLRKCHVRWQLGGQGDLHATGRSHCLRGARRGTLIKVFPAWRRLAPQSDGARLHWSVRLRDTSRHQPGRPRAPRRLHSPERWPAECGATRSYPEFG
jgi:hypothetical protein